MIGVCVFSKLLWILGHFDIHYHIKQHQSTRKYVFGRWIETPLLFRSTLECDIIQESKHFLLEVKYISSNLGHFNKLFLYCIFNYVS